jgi:hypothetical protein
LLRDDAVHRDVRQLNSLRRQFVHFSPAYWSIQTAGLPRIIDNCVRLTWRLILSHPASSRHLSEGRQAAMAKLFQDTSVALQHLGGQGFPLLVPNHLRLDRLT